MNTINDGIKLEMTRVRSILMIGQSNMAGRGDIGDVPKINNDSCFMLRNGRWQKMHEPINPDRPIFESKYKSGIGLAASFADDPLHWVFWEGYASEEAYDAHRETAHFKAYIAATADCLSEKELVQLAADCLVSKGVLNG